MHGTKERTTWLGTYRERRGRWHRIPYVISVRSTQGMSRSGWAVVAVALVLFVLVVLLEELLV